MQYELQHQLNVSVCECGWVEDIDLHLSEDVNYFLFLNFRMYIKDLKYELSTFPYIAHSVTVWANLDSTA